MYPADHCTDFPLVDERWAECFALDSAFVHATLFAGASIEDYALKQPMSKATARHLNETLSRLRTILSSSSGQAIGAASYIVLSLCIVASIYGDGNALNIHLSGLRRLIAMRGDYHDVFLSPRIMAKMDRLDLSAYICKGLRPPLPIGPFSWKPVYTSSPGCGQNTMDVYSEAVRDITDVRLLDIFRDLQNLATDIDQCFTTRSYLHGSRFRASVYSIQSRLLHIEDDSGELWDELLRLGMLACLSTYFRVPHRSVSGAYLKDKIRLGFLGIEYPTPEQINLLLWLLMVSAISISEPDEHWLVAEWRFLAPPREISYSQFKHTTLHRLIWVDCLYDEMGQKAFHTLQKHITS